MNRYAQANDSDKMKSCLTISLLYCLSFSIAHADNLVRVEDFGDNPGNITLYKYIPEDVPANAPLVVSLHGCRQNAEIYSRAGWIDLAREWKFYVLFPEQKLVNNPELRCWNWFEADNIRRGQGEIASIIQMIEKMQGDHSIDANRIYIEGLSAGGWMVPILLATYPDIFAGGATNAGGPAFCAMTKHYAWDFFRWWYNYYAIQNAYHCMDGIDKSPEQWGELARDNGLEDYEGPWPIISIWHGDDDDTVEVMNQQELVDQWTNLHGIDQEPDNQEIIEAEDTIIHKQYTDNEGKVLVETWLIEDMEHGIPIKEDSENKCGEENDYIFDEGICAVRQIGQFWGIQQ
jgi:poly(3-hydroxybutyrate) depolymerase